MMKMTKKTRMMNNDNKMMMLKKKMMMMRKTSCVNKFAESKLRSASKQKGQSISKSGSNIEAVNR